MKASNFPDKALRQRSSWTRFTSTMLMLGDAIKVIRPTFFLCGHAVAQLEWQFSSEYSASDRQTTVTKTR